MRLRSDIWVAAHLRRCGVEGGAAVLRRRGPAEAGAIFVKVDRLDGSASLYGPAPQSLIGAGAQARLFTPVLLEAESAVVEERMRREIKFDPDLWFLEIEDRTGRAFLDLAPEPPAL